MIDVHELIVEQRRAEFAAAQPVEFVKDVRDRHVLVARYRKARAIAKVLLASGGNVESATQLGTFELGRSLAAKAADVNVPSETTWALVVELVREVRP